MARTFEWVARGLLGAALAGCAATAGAAQGFYRFPSLHGEQVFFTAEGDLWRASTADGRAERLTTHPGAEQFPVASPDGRWLAFVGAYEGPQDVYVMPLAGGTPRRLTWEGRGVRVQGWTPQGEVLFSAPLANGLPDRQLFAVHAQSGARRMLPVSQASDGALLADGRTLLFTRGGLRGDNARGYRGGGQASLWQLDAAGAAEAVPLPAGDGNNLRPMPYGERIAFLSDRDGFTNLWSMGRSGSGLRQHTHHRDFDIRSAAIDGTRVVYALGADLWLVDLATADEPRRLDITLGGDFDQQRTRWVKRPQDFLTSVALAPDGERVVLAVRGRLATQGVGALRRAELPVASGTRCREPAFSHDSRHVFALCDSSGEFEVWRLPANGVGEAVQVTTGATIERAGLWPSPDGRHIAHTDLNGRLWLTELAANGSAGATRQIDRSTRDGDYQSLVWSPDGKALAIVRTEGNDARTQLLLHLLAERRSVPLTSDRYGSRSPAFTPDGRWLYFLSDRTFDVEGRGSPWGDRNLGPNFERRSKVYALALQPGQRFPFQPRDELVAASSAAPPAAAASAVVTTPGGVSVAVAVSPPPAAAASAPSRGTVPALVAEGLAQRLFEVPLAAGAFTELRTDGKRLYLLEPDRNNVQRSAAVLRTLAIDDSGAPAELFAADVKEVQPTPDGRRLLVVRSTAGGSGVGDILITEPAAKLPADVARAQVRWTDWALQVEPRAEWRQMFADAWRMHRDRFFDPRMRGVDWAAERRRYEPLVERVTDRSELNELLSQMVSALGTLHSQVYTTDLREGPDDVALAGLGAVLVKEPRGFRIERLYRGDPELPSEAPPLGAPGLGVVEGDVIVSVNGRAAGAVADVGELLRGQVGKQVLLGLVTRGGGQRQVVVQPVNARREAQLRLSDWEQANALRTLEDSQGRVGYLHLRAMTREDIGTFAREFYAHVEREGLIVDVRGNGGGSIDSWIIEKLLRRAWAYWQPRLPETGGSHAYPNMQQSFRGHLVVLADETTYSDGETFTEGIQRLKLGTVIGKRTAGAGVWLSDSNKLLDNGLMRAAESSQFAYDGTWLIEGRGVAPDIEVDNPPRATAGGADAQLAAALALLKRQIDEAPVNPPAPRGFPPLSASQLTDRAVRDRRALKQAGPRQLPATDRALPVRQRAAPSGGSER